MKRRILIFALAVLILFNAFATVFSPVAYADGDDIVETPVISSGNLVVIRSVETGQILLNSGGATVVSPTVSAKLMSAMLIYDKVDSLDTLVTVPPEAMLEKNVGVKGDISASMIGLIYGNVLSVKQLLSASLVSAAGDAVYTLAYFISDGDVDSFVADMNKRASEIGCTHTYFTNPVGLNDGVSYTTPEDVSLIASAFYKYNTLLNLSNQATYTLPDTTHAIHTKNYLLSDSLIAGYKLSGAKGMIAGQSRSDGGYCLITSAENNGLGYVFVVMEAPGEKRNQDGTREFPENNAYDDINSVFKWAVSSFNYVKLVSDHQAIGELSVDIASDSSNHVNYVSANEVEILLPVNITVDNIERKVNLEYDSLTAPVERGMKVGEMQFLYNDEIIASVDLVTNAQVDMSKVLYTFSVFKGFIESDTFKAIIKWVLILILANVIVLVGVIVYRFIQNFNAYKKRRAKDIDDGDDEEDYRKPEPKSKTHKKPKK